MIVAKAGAACIVAKQFSRYDQATFEALKQPNFFECSAERILDEVKPCEFDFLPGHKFIDFDTETYTFPIPANKMPSSVVRRWIKTPAGKYIPNDFPFCISISDGTNSFVVYDTLENKFKEFKKLAPLLSDRSIDKVGHNIDFDLQMLANAGVDLRGQLHDSLVSAKLCRADAFSNSLLEVAKSLPEGITIYEHMVAAYKAEHKITDYRQIPRELMTQYTCADVWNSLYALKHHVPLCIENGQQELMDIENKIVRITFSMERVGIKVDPEYKDVLIPELIAESEKAEQAIYDEAGCMFNINSSAQLADVLIKNGYGKHIKYSKPTEKMKEKGITQGNACLDKIEKERMIVEGVTIMEAISTYQATTKLLNTFAIKLYEMCDAENVVHCNFNAMEAKTGRFSVSQPSMQNMPRRKDSRVRGAFIAGEGYKLYDFDYISQEAKILAHYSKSVYLIDNINAGNDIHVIVAAILNGLSFPEMKAALGIVENELTTQEAKDLKKTYKRMREIAKSVEFAIVYGAGALKVASMTGLNLQDAKKAMADFLNNVPEVKEFIRIANKVAKERGFIRTRLNRFVYTERDREYACVNYVIQGSAADSTKSRMVVVHTYLKANKYKSKMLLQVHDSILNKIMDGEEHIVPKLAYLQADRELFRVPITVDVAQAYPSWRDKKDLTVIPEEPSAEEQAAMDTYDFWNESILEEA